MNKYICIHCHFYQPPRENPWLEEIEYQDSAYPYHDWNERITQECYRPNSEARILNSEDWVTDIVNNYSKISFNFGPTLLSWMQDKDPETYRHILEGDRDSVKQFGGHGSAIAQAYNHMIMPLANERDKETQVIWGIADFKKRFERDPESLWLPETAVDIATLEVLARHGMKYVILAPRQAKAFRPLNSNQQWTEIYDENFEKKKPYLINLPSGKKIAAFFYEGSAAKAVAFEGLLHNGETFATRLNQIFSPDQEGPQLAHIATDGETYGHHHRHGEMALAFAMRHLTEKNGVVITNYGQYLELYPPQDEIQIHENSSWSCAHGVERWRADCGCNSGQKPEWNQKWREPLRNAFDYLRDGLDVLYEKTAAQFVKDPWGARNAYVDVILDRSDENLKKFLRAQSSRELNDKEINQLLKLLEIQRHLLLMYTSCGWFFDEVSGVETVQNIQYAYRALDLAKEALGFDFEPKFKELLATCVSNLPELGNGRTIFEKYLLPAKVNFLKLGAHFAVDSVFKEYQAENSIYCYKVFLQDHHLLHSGRATLSWGHGRIISKVTRRDWPMVFGVIHLGDHNINAGVTEFFGAEKYEAFSRELESEFQRADFPSVIRTLDKWLGHNHYSLKDLFKNEQRKVTDVILKNSTKQIQDRLSEIYDQDYPLICYLSDLHIQLPKIYEHIAEFVQTRHAAEALHSDGGAIEVDVLKKYLQEAKSWSIHLDEAGLSRTLTTAFESRLVDLEHNPVTLEKLHELANLAELAGQLPFAFDLAPVQSLFFHWYKFRWLSAPENLLPEFIEPVKKIGESLKVRLAS